MNTDGLIAELDALLVEHDSFVSGLPMPNATSNVYYVDLLARLAETLDVVLVTEALSLPIRSGPEREATDTVWKACSVLGLALVVADVTAGLAAGSRIPATRAFRRWFPPEHVERLREVAGRREPGIG